MPSAVKEKFIDSLAEELNTSSHMVVADYQGLTAEEFNELRSSLGSIGAKFKVVKNRLAKIALQKTGFEELASYMKGPSAITYLGNDPAGVTKVLVNFSDKHTNLKIKAGRLYGSTADVKTLKSIANLPSREVLLATLMTRLNSPLKLLASMLNRPLQSLHVALASLAKKKESVPAQ